MAARKTTDSQTLVTILSEMSESKAAIMASRSEYKLLREQFEHLSAEITKINEHHDNHSVSLNEMRSRLDRLDGAKGLALALIGVVGVLGSICGCLLGKM